MKTNQINLFTQSSTTTNDLSNMDLKIKLFNRIHLNKSNETHTTHQQLYDTLYESITLDQDALDAQAARSSFHKRSHDNQDPPNNRKGENKKKRRKDVGEPSSRSSRLAKRRTTWFDLFLKSNIDKDENHILGPSTVFIAKKFKELIQKDELSIADIEGAGLERLKVQYNNDLELEYHVSQLKVVLLSKDRTKENYTTSITKHYAARYYKEGIEDRIPERWSKEVHRYHFEDLNGIHHWEEDKIDVFKAGMSVLRNPMINSEFSYANLPRLSVNDVEDMYLLYVQDNLHHLRLEFVKDFNNALLMFIRRTVIKNRLSEVKKFSDGTLVKIQFDMLSKNKLGSGKKRLKGRDWTDYDVKSSREMLKKIDEILRHRE
ncbi:hypothetical protein Tco_0803365 [Tanacetum coccineum]|uniref:Uncharacterized protein n=1 Tax=Tanacetum coccineum TaxID=301880 RepID=A0ABQ5A526_9ASTR